MSDLSYMRRELFVKTSELVRKRQMHREMRDAWQAAWDASHDDSHGDKAAAHDQAFNRLTEELRYRIASGAGLSRDQLEDIFS